MKAPRILSKSITSLLLIGALGALKLGVDAATFNWDGEASDPTDLSAAANWTDDTQPSVSIPDVMQWDGLVAGPLSLVYNDASYAGAAGNPGVDLNVTANQTSSLLLDASATNTANAFRMNNLTIAAGAGAVSFGNGVNAFNITLGGAAGQTHTWTNNSSSAVVVDTDVVIGLGGGGAHNLALGGSGDWNFKTAIGGGALTIVKNGSGTLTLTGLNTYTGGLVLNGGKLNINNGGAIGNTTAGALTINGGTIDNTSGALVTTTTAKAQNWNGDFTFLGTNNLNFNTGVVTLGGGGTYRTVTINGNAVLTEGSLVGAGYGLTKAGTGTLALGSAISRITGDLNITGGLVQIGAQDFYAGGLTGSGTIENGSGTARWLFIQNAADKTFSGTIRNGTGQTLGVSKGGAGVLTLTGVNSYTGQTTMRGGVLEYGSANAPGITQTLGPLVFEFADSTVRSSFSGDGAATPANLAFTTYGRTAGATGNFAVVGGVNGSTNQIRLTSRAAGFIDQGTYFGGDSYAWLGSANSFVRAMAYGADAGAVTSGAAASLASATHQEFTGDVTDQATATFTTLRNSGNNAFTLTPGAIVTVNGILKAGNVAGGATISGGAGIQAASGAELVIRTSGVNDALTINTPILANGTNALTTSGAGTLTLAGANTYTGTTTINSNVNLSGSILAGAVNINGGGTLNLTGTINGANAANGLITVGNSPGANAVLNISGGTLNAGRTATSPSLAVANVPNASGFVRMTSGALTTAGLLNIGNGGGGGNGSNPYAALNLSGGTVSSGSWLVLGASNDWAVLNQSGGSLTVKANRLTIAAGNASSIAAANFSGGTFSSPGGIYVGETGTGFMNVSGAASVSTGDLKFGTTNSGGPALAGYLNLNGGTLTASGITKGNSSAGAVFRVNFNGGTLKPSATNGTFFADLGNTEAYVYGGGANIDTSGFDITIAEQLRAPVGSGLSSIAVASGGTGYLDTPLVVISGGSGTGAQAVANVSNGVVTGFTITNPGSGYSPTDVLTVSLYGGGASAPAAVGSVLLGSNTGGGLTKTGNGTLTLSGDNSFTGNVVVSQGTLVSAKGLVANPVTSALGNDTVPGRTITVAPGATLRLTANDSFGNALANPVNLPALIISGTLNTTRYNQIGALTLNGATLSSSNTNDSGNYQNFQFLGDVNVIGSAPSFITASGATNFDANHLSGATIFNVADVTGNANADLVVSAPFRDQSGNYGMQPGGLVKAGAGRMDLTAVSTYTGSTTVSGGVLQLTGAASINSSNGVTISGAGAKLILASSSAFLPAVTLTEGSIEAVGAMSSVTVADLASNTITTGNGVPGATLTIDALSFSGAAKLILLANGTSAPLVTSTLTTGGLAGGVTIDVSNVVWDNGQTYDLISYGALFGSLADFKKGTIGGLGARQSATLGDSGSAITLSIAGDLPVWTGLASGKWTTAAIPSPKNWKLQTNGSGADFLLNDTVLFNDTASGTTSIDISDANVNPVATTFNNNSKTYTLGSSGGFGIASGSLTKNGNGTLNLGGAHTYTGVTQLNAGTTNLTGSLGNTAITVAAGATLNIQAANAVSKSTLTVNGTLNQTVDNALGGTAALVLNNGGTLTRPNAHSGGTTLAGGAFNLNHGGAIGSGLLTISAGTIDNTSGAPVALTNNNAQDWAGSGFVFTGTNPLNLGTGAVTMDGDPITGVFTITNNSALPGASLTVGGLITAGATGLKTLAIDGVGGTVLSGNFTKGNGPGIVVNDASPGTLTLSGAASVINTLSMNGGPNSIVELGAGNLTLANGGGNILQSTTGGTINATGGGSIILGSANGDFGTAPGTTLTVNAKISGTNAVDFYSANGGLGRIVLAAANNSTGAVNVENTRIVIPASGAINGPNTANVGQVTVGTVAGAMAVLDLNGGAINATKTASPSMVVGNVNGATAAVNVTGGALNTTSELWVGSIAGSYGAFTMNGGAVNVGSWLPVGRNGSGYFQMSGGTLNVTSQNFTTGSFAGTNGILSGSFGVVNLTGGAVNVTSTAANQGGFIVGESGTGNLNVSGTAALSIAGARGLNFATNAGGAGVANLNGGVVTTPMVQQGAGSGILSFDGGTLKASASSATFMQGLAGAYVNKGGAIIDDGGFAIMVAQPLLAPTGNGVKQILFLEGSGYVSAPLVQITGDGVGATAVANIDANGNLTGITITNPGVNYTTAGVNLIGGGGAGALLDDLTVGPNVQGGGFTKKGAGTLTLSGANTYTGPTVVESGTLALTGSISGSTSITARAGATFNIAGLNGGFSLASGQTLKGAGSVVGNVNLSAGSKLAPGDAVGSLSFSGNLDLTLAVTPVASASLVFDLAGPASSDRVAFLSGALNVGGGVLGFDDFAFTTLAGLSEGTYTLFDGSSPIVGTLDTANLTGPLGGGFSGALGFGDNGNDLVLTVVPEPGSATMLFAGAGALLGLRRFRRRSA